MVFITLQLVQHLSVQLDLELVYTDGTVPSVTEKPLMVLLALIMLAVVHHRALCLGDLRR